MHIQAALPGEKAGDSSRHIRPRSPKFLLTFYCQKRKGHPKVA